MNNMLRKSKNLIFVGAVALSAFLLGGCEQNFFVSPSELLTPPAQTKVTPTIVAESTMTPTATPTPMPTETPTPTPEPTVTPTSQSSPTPEVTNTPTPTNTPSPIPTVPVHFDAPVTDPSDVTFIVNREFTLGEKYVPSDLVSIKHSQYPNSREDKYKLRSVAAEAFDAMCDAALDEKQLDIVGISGYRSYERQYNLYAGYLVRNGISHTNYYSAQPGTSEHQTGLAIDISCKSCGYDLVNSFAKSPEGRWVADNCWRFGFILRYSEDDVDITGYAYEPWHIRYVGIPLAYYLYNSGLTLEEYYGCPCTIDREYLDSTPLIDTSAAKFAEMFLSNTSKLGSLAYIDDKKTHVLINANTYMPYLIPVIKDINGAAGTDAFGKKRTSEPVRNIHGEYYPSDDPSYVLGKPVCYINGSIAYDKNGAPIFLEPLVSWDGDFVHDSEGNIIFKDCLKSPDGTELVLDADGNPIHLTPVRDSNYNVVLDANGEPTYYKPILYSRYEYRRDAEGNLIWPADYESACYLEMLVELTEESPLYLSSDDLGEGEDPDEE